mmetsp:Transcript_26980/g.77260  ORF Transcript_26980/g.77260 Transcript_26980/m.77260 type:complete len:299 (-) Transcript_26980:123-1019(-)
MKCHARRSQVRRPLWIPAERADGRQQRGRGEEQPDEPHVDAVLRVEVLMVHHHRDVDKDDHHDDCDEVGGVPVRYHQMAYAEISSALGQADEAQSYAIFRVRVVRLPELHEVTKPGQVHQLVGLGGHLLQQRFRAFHILVVLRRGVLPPSPLVLARWRRKPRALGGAAAAPTCANLWVMVGLSVATHPEQAAEEARRESGAVAAFVFVAALAAFFVLLIASLSWEVLPQPWNSQKVAEARMLEQAVGLHVIKGVMSWVLGSQLPSQQPHRIQKCTVLTFHGEHDGHREEENGQPDAHL